MTSDGTWGALAGVRVLDLSQALSGPLCAQLLADHGADVIKVEPPSGDMGRQIGGHRDTDTEHAFGALFANCNRNKRSIVLDLKSDQGKATLLALADRADILIENFRAGVMDRLGLSYEVLSVRNPRLVYAAIRGFGDPRSGKSPYVDRPAFDLVAQAMGGIVSTTGAETPVPIGAPWGDSVPAIMTAYGIVLALLTARTTGKGQFVDVSMVDVIASLCHEQYQAYSIKNIVPTPQGSRNRHLVPFGIFKAADGWVAVCAPHRAQWTELCRVMQRSDLLDDVRFATDDARRANAVEIEAMIEAFTTLHTRKQLDNMIDGSFPFGPVFDAHDLMTDPHFAARDMRISIEQPGAEPVIVPGVPVKLSQTPGRVARRAPRLGEHTQAILAELRLDGK
ncbi:CaiB/BaiF CoA transferase family protein [Bradyrhizobium sp.]|uniref:CaiB/BaiF CoA transferase family protein n=1 Tax=Bradyrhizobium sp. TaxID=376 RepID=UPI003C1CC910